GTSIQISRKIRSATTWTSIATLPDTASSYSDSSLIRGTVMEYQVVRSVSTGNAYGYLLAGYGKPVTLNRGRVALVVEDRIDTQLQDVVNRLHVDLICDGWQVSRLRVRASDSVTVVRRALFALYQKEATMKCAFLLGHVPVPYSGQMGPDGHTDHVGAWPADVYYGDLNGAWTDNTVNTTAPSRNANDNIPGDGKFDQNNPPTAVEISVGRVDFARLSQFSQSDTALIRRYLNKNHLFRYGGAEVIERGIIDDNFTGMGEGFSQCAWRGFPTLVSDSLVTTGDILTQTSSSTWLLGYGCGGGSFTSCSGVATTADFASKKVSAVFLPLFGSYFGDFDSDNNLLRAAIAAEGLTLATFWSGRPNFFLHTLAQGETLGDMLLLTQGNAYYYQNAGSSARGVHVALIGDPTLQLYPFKPPQMLQLTRVNRDQVSVSWAPSQDSGCAGYYVERADSLNGNWSNLTSIPITGTTYTDVNASNTRRHYKVRAVRLKQTPSGAFYQTSQSILDSVAPSTIGELAYAKEARLVDIAPHPFSNVLTIRLCANMHDWSIVIVDIMGRVVYKRVEKSSAGMDMLHVNTRFWARGVYTAFVRNGQRTSQHCLVAQ
ncbi:MAG: hypothetical protein JNL74_23735, partial [Fibrobacteres bacterium]|nr:hypothetical protein [Fibrobacterota bacterium]